MDFLGGGDLFFHMMRSENETFPISDVIFYTSQVAKALDFIHSKDVIYRDLKLENIALRLGFDANKLVYSILCKKWRLKGLEMLTYYISIQNEKLLNFQNFIINSLL